MTPTDLDVFQARLAAAEADIQAIRAELAALRGQLTEALSDARHRPPIIADRDSDDGRIYVRPLAVERAIPFVDDRPLVAQPGPATPDA